MFKFVLVLGIACAFAADLSHLLERLSQKEKGKYKRISSECIRKVNRPIIPLMTISLNVAVHHFRWPDHSTKHGDSFDQVLAWPSDGFYTSPTIFLASLGLGSAPECSRNHDWTTWSDLLLSKISAGNTLSCTWPPAWGSNVGSGTTLTYCAFDTCWYPHA